MKTLIAIPCMDMVPVVAVNAFINLRKPEGTGYAFKSGALVYDSRNTFVANAIEKGYDRILWLDSDMVYEPDMLERLGADMDAGADVVCGIFFKRHIPTVPVIYKKLEYTETEGRVKAEAESYLDYPKNSVFEIQGCGFGGVLVKTELLKRVWDKFGPPFTPGTQIGEDLACCLKLRDIGARLWCDSRVKFGHVGLYTYDEEVYLAQRTSETGRNEKV